MNLNFSNSVLYPTRQEVKHCVGNVYHIQEDGDNLYVVLSQVGADMVALICLDNDANRYSNPVKVKFIRAISLGEFTILSGSRLETKFTYVGRVETVLKILVPPISDELQANLLVNKIFGDKDKNAVPGS